jgi:hypothetical protein
MPWIPPSSPLYRPGSLMITADLRITLAHSTTHHFGIYNPVFFRKSSARMTTVVRSRRIESFAKMRLFSPLQPGRHAQTFRMVQGHVPTGPLLQESIGQGLVVWVSLHGHISRHRGETFSKGVDNPCFHISCELRVRLKPRIQDHSGFFSKGGEEMAPKKNRRGIYLISSKTPLKTQACRRKCSP